MTPKTVFLIELKNIQIQNIKLKNEKDFFHLIQNSFFKIFEKKSQLLVLKLEESCFRFHWLDVKIKKEEGETKTQLFVLVIFSFSQKRKDKKIKELKKIEKREN